MYEMHIFFLIRFKIASTSQVSVFFFFLSTCQCTVCQSFQILSQKDSNLETMIRAFVVLSKWCGVRYYEIVILITVLRNQLLPSVTIILNFKISVTN